MGRSKRKHLNMESLKTAMERTIGEGECSVETTTANNSRQSEVEVAAINGLEVRVGAEQHEEAGGGDEVDESSSSSENEFHMVYSSEFSSTDAESRPSSTSSSTRGDLVGQKPDMLSTTSDELDLMSGYEHFIGACLYRKMLIDDALTTSPVGTNSDPSADLRELLGVEHKLIGAVTFRIRYLQKNRRVVHIIFLAVRHHWRGKHVGSVLVKLLKDTQVVGPYDAIVVHADMGTRSFFHRLGFTDNLLLNEQWSEVAEEYTNCRLMTFVPGLTAANTAVSKLYPAGPDANHMWLTKLDHELEACMKQTEQAHCANLLLCRKLREELIQMKSTVSCQVTKVICLTTTDVTVLLLARNWSSWNVQFSSFWIIINFRKGDSSEGLPLSH